MKRRWLVALFAAVLLALGSVGASAAGGGGGSGDGAGAQRAGEKGGPNDPNCEDGGDNDGDQLVDDADPDCQKPGCQPSSKTPNKCFETTYNREGPFGHPSCDDNLDNDGDGLVDELDPGCAPPPREICNNNADDDGDGKVDAEDTDCPAVPEICNNNLDDDRDGLVDGADPDCQTDEDPCVNTGIVATIGDELEAELTGDAAFPLNILNANDEAEENGHSEIDNALLSNVVHEDLEPLAANVAIDGVVNAGDEVHTVNCRTVVRVEEATGDQD